jgi:hypothetical protein
VTIRAKLYSAIVVAVAGLALVIWTAIWAMDSLGDLDEIESAFDDFMRLDRQAS